MSAQLLQRLVETDALYPPVDWQGLAAAHVTFDSLNETDEFEQVLERNALRDHDSTLVLGGSGSGKSSMIAAVAERVSPQRWIVRVQGGSDEALLTREGFARHIADEALRSLSQDEHAPPTQAKRAKKQLADSRKVSRGGHLLGKGYVQVRSAAEEVTRTRQTSDLYAALDELAEVSADAGRRMLLVVEDTQVFMPPSDHPGDASEERAERFVGQVLPFVARELRVPSLVAVPDHYEHLVDKHLGGTVKRVSVPVLADPVEGLKRIMASQALRVGLHTDEAPILDDEALTWLAGRLSSGSDLRRVLRAIYDGAVKVTREDAAAESISLAAVMSQF